MRINKIKNKKKVYILIAAAIILVGAGIGAYLYFAHKNTPHSFTTKTGSKITSDPNVPGGSSKTSENQGLSTDKDDKPTSNPPKPSSDVKPATPVGTFVSNHHPNLGGDPAPNSLSSTCTTTPGVSCKIQFTRNGITKELPLKTTNSSGNVDWYWTLQEVGLTQGTWQVTAVAVNGNSTTSSNDPMNLEVRP